jgi:Flp pilus assembly protein TadB
LSRDERKEKIRKVIDELYPELSLEELEKQVEEIKKLSDTGKVYTFEYLQFLEEIKKRPKSFYEKLCYVAEKVVRVKPDEKTREKLERDIDRAFMNATPSGVYSLFILLLSLAIGLGIFSLLFFKSLTLTFLVSSSLAYFSYFSLTHPSRKAREVEVKMASDLVIAVLYMAIYMRISPNLEEALRFAANNCPAPLSWDLKRLLWLIETGYYSSCRHALIAYMAKWKDKCPEFVESLQLLIASTDELEERRLAMLDEAVEVILTGIRQKMERYTYTLKMPVMIVFGLGVMLPVLGLVLLPIAALLLRETVNAQSLFFLYDILIPCVVLWYINNVLRTRPVTFSPPDISRAKDIPPIGKLRFLGKYLPVLPFAILISLPVLLYGVLGVLSVEITEIGHIFTQCIYSAFIILGVGIFVFAYSYLDSFQKMKVRKEVERIEEEFGEALFQFGNVVASGKPLESALEYAIRDMRGLKICELFEAAKNIVQNLGFTLEQALFDRDVGVIWRYPSKLIYSVFTVILKTAEKSTELAGLSMLVISRYLKSIKVVKEELKNLLSETLSSMKFLAMVLAPVIGGVIVTLGIVIMEMLFKLGGDIRSVMAQAGNVPGLPTMVYIFSFSQGLPIAPALFQIIVGLYVLETSILLAYFINKIEYGEDPIGERATIANTVLISSIMYFLTWFVTFSIFAPMISSILFNIT